MRTDSPAPRYWHGTREDLRPGDLIRPGLAVPGDGGTGAVAHVMLTLTLDEAIWSAELASGEGASRVYTVRPLGAVRPLAEVEGHQPPGHPAMSLACREGLEVLDEVREWTLYHGTRAELAVGELIAPGHRANFGHADRRANHVYLARTLDAAIWGAELARGEGRGHIYIVEPTGVIEEDPNLTDRKFRGNPTKSFRSRDPLRVVGELRDWQGHPPERVAAMKAGLARLAELGQNLIDD